MCILLKLDYAKFGVSSLFFPKVIKERPLWGWLDPFGKERVNEMTYLILVFIFSLRKPKVFVLQIF